MSVPRSFKDRLSSHEAHIAGTLRVLIAAKDADVKKVAYASSSSVYGDTPKLPKRADMPVNPLSLYAVTKAASGFYCKVFLTIIVMLSFFTRAALKETPYWSKNVETAFYLSPHQ